MRVLCLAGALSGPVVATACSGGGSSTTPAPKHTTTTTTLATPTACLDAMKQAEDVFGDQADIATRSGDLDDSLADLANAVSTDNSARRSIAQAKVDAATQQVTAMRSRLAATQADFESSRVACTTDRRSRTLPAHCRSMLDQAALVMAAGQKVIAGGDQLLGLSRQVVTDFQNGSFTAGNNLIDQHNDLLDGFKSSADEAQNAESDYADRLDVCAG